MQISKNKEKGRVLENNMTTPHKHFLRRHSLSKIFLIMD